METAVAGSNMHYSRYLSGEVRGGADRPAVLAVDDDPLNLKILADVLGEEFFDIVTVTSGGEALSQLETREVGSGYCRRHDASHVGV